MSYQNQTSHVINAVMRCQNIRDYESGKLVTFVSNQGQLKLFVDPEIIDVPAQNHLYKVEYLPDSKDNTFDGETLSFRSPCLEEIADFSRYRIRPTETNYELWNKHLMMIDSQEFGPLVSTFIDVWKHYVGQDPYGDEDIFCIAWPNFSVDTASILNAINDCNLADSKEKEAMLIGGYLFCIQYTKHNVFHDFLPRKSFDYKILSHIQRGLNDFNDKEPKLFMYLKQFMDAPMLLDCEKFLKFPVAVQLICDLNNHFHCEIPLHIRRNINRETMPIY